MIESDGAVALAICIGLLVGVATAAPVVAIQELPTIASSGLPCRRRSKSQFSVGANSSRKVCWTSVGRNQFGSEPLQESPSIAQRVWVERMSIRRSETRTPMARRPAALGRPSWQVWVHFSPPRIARPAIGSTRSGGEHTAVGGQTRAGEIALRTARPVLAPYSGSSASVRRSGRSARCGRSIICQIRSRAAVFAFRPAYPVAQQPGTNRRHLLRLQRAEARPSLAARSGRCIHRGVAPGSPGVLVQPARTHRPGRSPSLPCPAIRPRLRRP